MRLKNVPGAREAIAASDLVIKDVESLKGKWREFWGNDKEIHIEVGMGKGKFMMGMAKAHPDINYIGIEMYSSVLYRAVQKLELEPLDNLRYILLDAKDIANVFEKGEVDRIYLNFSDPWPKDRHAKRRLTSHTFLPVFKKILKNEGELILKTDNRGLFEFSLISFQQFGMDFHDVCLDLHHSEGYEDNIQTEYERKFSPFGPIYRIVTTFKGEE